MRTFSRVAQEALAVGLLLIVIGSLVSYGVSKTYPKTESYLVPMELSLFLTGVAVHVLLEYTGYNKYFCDTAYV